MTGSVYIDDHARMYQRGGSKKQESREPWLYEQRLLYPAHPQHHQLISTYEETKQAHARAVKVVQFAIGRKRENFEQWDDKDFEQCQRKVDATRKLMEEAEASLRKFNNHIPQERISLYESEIASLEEQLTESLALEHEYTKQLLEDPNAAKARLERQVSGGNSSEYSPEQLAELRRLRGVVKSIEGKITRCQMDVARIRELAADQERREQIQAEMDALIPKFGKAAAKFTEALGELQSAAREHEILCDVSRVKIPVGAKLKLNTSPYDGASVITLEF